MDKEEIINKIINKKEFSQLPIKDVEMAFSNFEKKQISDEQKIKLTRALLHKTFSSFSSQKLFSLKNKPAEWILKKHLSTRERFPYYREIYSRIFKYFSDKTKVNIFDLGAGVNGFSYKYLAEFVKNLKYFAIEGIGQLVLVTNSYFLKEKMEKNAQAIHLSLFELEKIKEIISMARGKKVIFLFKVIDSLETLKRDYSKILISELVFVSDLVIVSFPVESMIKRKKFMANRKWISDFIEKNFYLTDVFEYGGEKYMCFRKK